MLLKGVSFVISVVTLSINIRSIIHCKVIKVVEVKSRAA